MGASSSASPQQRRAERRSIRATFAAVVAGPAVGLMLAWALAAVVTLARHGFSGGHREVVRLTLLAGGGMVVIGVAVTLMGWFAGRLSREVSGLAALAEEVAGA